MRVSVTLGMLALAGQVWAASGTLRVDAPLRQGPSAATELLGTVPAGTAVEVLGESAGWRQVRTPDGRTGYLWGERFTDAPERAAAPPARTTADELRDLRTDVTELRQRPAPATASDLERLQAELARLREVTERLDGQVRPVHVARDTPIESTPGLVPALLALGAVVGWTTSRLLQRRSDRRQRNRLRL